MIRVVLADDHPFVRSGIRNILRKTPDIVVVGEAADGLQALELVEDLEPDVLVLDMEMPGMKGSDVANKLRTEGVGLPVLVLSAYEDKQFIMGMLASGAFGYLTKDEVPDTIVNAIRGVARGQRGWVSKRVAARIAVWLQREKPDEFEFTRQDVEMLRMMLEGKTNKEIAMKQHLPENDIEKTLEKLVGGVRCLLERIL